MAYKYGTSLVPGAHHHGGAGLGVRGDAVPGPGLFPFGGYLYAGLTLPADAAKEVRGLITRWPSGTLVANEDSSFTYSGPTDYALYQLYVDGVASGTDIGYGPGIGRLDLNVGSDLNGGVTLDDVSPSGTFGSTVGILGGDTTLDNIAPAGAFGSAASGLSGDTTLDNVAPAGTFSTTTSSMTGGVTLDNVAPAGTFSPQVGTVVAGPYVDKLGATLVSAVVANVVFIKLTDRTSPLSLTNQVLDSGGMLTVVNSSLTPGASYMMVSFSSDGSVRGCELVVAT